MLCPVMVVALTTYPTRSTAVPVNARFLAMLSAGMALFFANMTVIRFVQKSVSIPLSMPRIVVVVTKSALLAPLASMESVPALMKATCCVQANVLMFYTTRPTVEAVKSVALLLLPAIMDSVCATMTACWCVITSAQMF